jgi:hypothetical protein
MATDDDEAPYLFPKFLLSAIPASYAWQVYGWGTGLVVYLVTFALLVGLSWTFIVTEWPLKWLVRARVALIVLSMIAVGVSAMETCSTDLSVCHRVFGLKIP